ncbi:MAG: hypothetical protein DRG78_00070 [Epsilonproteobacteria bacterium]|nr:MAG: hypothetical protein DRG78_00070 [Campylobacterota bacterium]
MIHELSIKNFKSLNTKKISLSPLTILSGVNNAGKSTFIQSMLELSSYSDDRNTGLTSSPILSNFSTKVLNNKKSKQIIFKIKVDINDGFYIKLHITYKYNKDIKGGFPSYYKLITKNKDKKTILKLKKNKPNDPYEIYSDLGLSLLYGKVISGVELPKIFKGKGDFEFIGFVPIQCKLQFDENKSLSQWFHQTDETSFISLSVGKYKFLLNSILNIKYIGPLRNSPSEFYFFENRGAPIDSKGGNTFEVLDRKQKLKIECYKDLETEEISSMELLEATKFWLKYFYEESSLKMDHIAENLVQVKINGHSIKHSGFGFSQLLPIIVQALLLKENEILLLEQPEIHLHPELEYKLAYFLLCICKNKRQIIAETHSEHIINQLVISKVKDNSLQKLFKVYFLEKEKQKETLFTEILIDDYGEITNWPKGFFDKYLAFANELVLLRREKALNKQKQNKE